MDHVLKRGIETRKEREADNICVQSEESSG